jgi:hypothetical protein
VIDKDIFEDLFVLELAKQSHGQGRPRSQDHSQIPSLRQTIYARGMAGPVERLAPLDKVHVMPSGTDEPPRK